MEEKELLNIKDGRAEMHLSWTPDAYSDLWLIGRGVAGMYENEVVGFKLPNNEQGIKLAQEIIDALKHWIKLIENKSFL